MMCAKVTDIREAAARKKAGILTQRERKEYLDGGGSTCPHCKSESIDASDYDFEGDCVISSVSCATCGNRWKDIYRLADVQA